MTIAPPPWPGGHAPVLLAGVMVDLCEGERVGWAVLTTGVALVTTIPWYVCQYRMRVRFALCSSASCCSAPGYRSLAHTRPLSAYAQKRVHML